MPFVVGVAVKFNPAPSNYEFVSSLYRSEDGAWEVYIFSVLFGWRVQVHEVRCHTLPVNYCCAQNQALLGATFALCLANLETMDTITEAAILQALPPSRDKLYRDRDLLTKLNLIPFVEPEIDGQVSTAAGDSRPL